MIKFFDMDMFEESVSRILSEVLKDFPVVISNDNLNDYEKEHQLYTGFQIKTSDESTNVSNNFVRPCCLPILKYLEPYQGKCEFLQPPSSVRGLGAEVRHIFVNKIPVRLIMTYNGLKDAHEYIFELFMRPLC